MQKLIWKKKERQDWLKIKNKVSVMIFTIILLVSKTTKELILSWDQEKSHEDPVSVAQDLRMPQFEMQKITTNRCHETNHMGKKKTKIQ